MRPILEPLPVALLPTKTVKNCIVWHPRSGEIGSRYCRYRDGDSIDSIELGTSFVISERKPQIITALTMLSIFHAKSLGEHTYCSEVDPRSTYVGPSTRIDGYEAITNRWDRVPWLRWRFLKSHLETKYDQGRSGAVVCAGH